MPGTKSVAWKPPRFEGGDLPNDLAVALRRVGEGDRERLQWLLNFAARDLEGATEGGLLDTAWEILAFTLRPDLPRLSSEYFEAAKSGTWSEDLTSVLKNQMWSKKEIDLQEVPEIHDRLKEELRLLFQAALCGYTPTDTMFVLQRSTKGGPVTKAIRAPTKDCFFLAAFELLERMGERIRRCADLKCDRYFVASKRQTFCSPRCSQRLRTARYRKEHSEKASDMRHAAYRRKKTKESGNPNLKIERRKRKKEK